MDQRERAMLEESLRLSRENNELIRKLYSGYRWGRLFRVAYWVIIVGVAIGAFYFIQPFIERLSQAAEQIHEGVNSSKDAIETFKGYFGGGEETPAQ